MSHPRSRFAPAVCRFSIVLLTCWCISLAGCGSQPDALPTAVGDPPSTGDTTSGTADGTPIEPASVDNGTAPEPVTPDEAADMNQPPVADAGSNQSVVAGDRIALDGSASADPNDDPLLFEWSLSSQGASVVLQNTATPVASFVAPAVDANTALRFTLRVSDGIAESEDTVVVEVRPRIQAASVGPMADAGADQAVQSGTPVTLNGSGSQAGAGGALSFDWVQLSGPTVVLDSPQVTNPSFAAPAAIGSPVELAFEITVAEGDLMDSDEVVVAVEPLVQAPTPQPSGGGTDPPSPTDNCPSDPNKTEPGVCGCGVPDADSDGDGVADCIDGCPNDFNKTAAGVCGCGIADTDNDADGTPNCLDGCPNDRNKTSAGACGCGVADGDRDGDGTPDCIDGCPDDPTTINPADCAPNVGGAAQTDWDLVMLRLLNRARLDPTGEASRLGSSVMDTRAPVPPLAYDRSIGQSATNHNTWMHLNLGGIASGRAPDSFTHYETLDGLSTGTPATFTPGYTGATLGQRITAAGFNWGSVGENILTGYSSNTILVNEAKMISNDKSWWESTGHRNNMLSANYSVFGHHVEVRTFTPPLGGLNAPFDNLVFATQDFGRPLSNPRTYIFGVLYRDHDGNNTWTPREVGDPNREGLAAVAFHIRNTGTATVVTSDTTMDNGAFSARVGDGAYDVVFTGSSLPGGALTLLNLTVSGSNVDAGDVRITANP